MTKRFLFVFSLCWVVVLNAQQSYTKTLKLMGSRYDITVVANNQADGDFYIKTAVNEIKRIESVISSWDPTSQISQVNRNAGITPVKVDQEVIDLVQRAIKISDLSDGAFDISYASMDKIWKFDGSMKEKPSDEAIAKSVEKINYKNIVVDRKNQTLYLKEKGMKIGFGAIGKGYSADSARNLLKELGVVGGIINASGDLTTWGTQPDGKDWLVGITNPLNKLKAFSWTPLKDYAVATSGTYEKVVSFDGKNYSHIIDPRTGWPVADLVSVSIFSPSAELCDALATTVFVLGVENGLFLVEQLKGVYCMIVDSNNKIYQSENLKKNEESN